MYLNIREHCGSATLVGLPAYQIDRLQSVLNAAARLVYSSRRYDHVTPLLRELQDESAALQYESDESG